MTTRTKDFPLPPVLPIDIGSWRRAKDLGAGAFGTVHMWQNVQTQEKIAIKKCKNHNGDAMGRWQTEMKLIENMRHPNIVSFVAIPDELRSEYPKYCSLGMEYCSEGDLRKFLGRSEYPCGLPEHHVLDVMGDIGSAIKYLHEQKNMHRDLKPENIVLKPRPGCEGRYQFKVTDLGYAKDLDIASCGHSFVGTLAYLAPEVAIGNNTPNSFLRYYTQVDYWSFGLVVFECITGHRPFLYNLPPIRALTEVKNKEDDIIHVWLDTSTGEPKPRFEKTIPRHHINPVLVAPVTKWLSLMLRIKEKKRGGEGDEWFRLLQDDILGQKYAKVINVADMQQMTFPLDQTAYLQALHKKIKVEKKVPMAEQLLLLKSGSMPLPNKHIMEQVESNSRHPDDMVIFLFEKSIEDWPVYKCRVPPLISRYLDSTNSGYTRTDERELMNLGLDNTLTNIKTGYQFHDALSALRTKIRNLSDNLRKCLKDFEAKHLKVSGMVELFTASLDKDVKENERSAENSTQICSNAHFQEQCVSMRENVNEWDEELKNGQALIEDAEKQLSKTTGYFTETQLSGFHEYLKTLKGEAIKMHYLFRCECRKQDKQRSQSTSTKVSEKRHREFRQRQLRQFIDDIWSKVRERIEEELKPQNKLRKMMRFFISHHVKLEKLFYDMTDKANHYSLMKDNITKQQQDRQHSIWNMLQYMKDVYRDAFVYTKDSGALAGLEAQEERLQSFIDGFMSDDNLIAIMNFSPDSETPESNTVHPTQHQNTPPTGVHIQTQTQQNFPASGASNPYSSTNGIRPGVSVGSQRITSRGPAPPENSYRNGVSQQNATSHVISPQISANSHPGPTHPNGPLKSVPSDTSGTSGTSNPIDPSLLRLSDLRISKESTNS